MAEQGFQERTERATPRRREKAREEGRVARSTELNSAIIVVLGITFIYLLGPSMASQLMAMMTGTFTNAPAIAAADPTFAKTFGDSMVKFFSVMGPVLAVMLVIGMSSNIVQVGFHISTKALEPKLDKLDVLKGLKRLFSVRSLVTLVRDSLKLFFVGFIGYLAIASEFEEFFMLPEMATSEVAATMGRMALTVALKIGAAMLILAAADFAYQKYEFEKSIKMSKQDIKDESKDTEGSPQTKARVRQIQREMSRQRMMADVPSADVVVTNPTHIAVALKYSPDESTAPIVLAKGERLIAQRIKEIALDCGIPVFQDKPLARALFKLCDVGGAIPSSLFRAVAEVLAYVYRLKGKVAR